MPGVKNPEVWKNIQTSHPNLNPAMSQYFRGSGPCHHQVLALNQEPTELESDWAELLAQARILITETASEGTSFVPLAKNQPTALVLIPNFTPTTLEVHHGRQAFFIPPGAVHAFGGLRNASELELRRADCEDEPVTLLWAADCPTIQTKTT